MTTSSWRPLARSDVPEAVRLVNAEGWTFVADDVARLIEIGGGVVVEDDERLAGLLTLALHEDQAWIGNVVVSPEARGRGLGRVLVDGALTRAREAGVPIVGLYSVLPAISLYERAGFRRAGDVVSLTGAARPADAFPEGVRPFEREDLAAVQDMDRRAAGTRRDRMLGALLRDFPAHAFVYAPAGEVAGFVISKPSETGSEIGPLVTRAPEDARAVDALVDAALATLPEGDVEAGVHRANAAAVAAFKARGFREGFPAVTMYHGDGPEVDGSLTVAVAGMEKG